MAASVPTEFPARMNANDFTQDLDLSVDELHSLLDLSAQVKRNPTRFARALTGRYAALLFEKPSLRTRITFELAVKQLGGDSILSTGLIGEREPIKDVARNLDRWTNLIVARTFTQRTVQDLAKYSSVPVINALSDLYHPCQALADVLTVKEKFGKWRGLKLTFVGDGNNVAHSLMLTCTRLGMDFALACPSGYEPNPEVVATAQKLAAEHGTTILVTNDAAEGVQGSHVVYTDVWASMGQESEAIERRARFQPYQVNEELMEKAESDAIFMHCLPAKRNQETTDGVIESAQSVVFDQAENRLHAQKALMLMLLG
ncbi:MAG: ornithine carbamoyltransferase [Acidobacteria bacterium]|nr:ornithine carbamoyltransferase [Acidobacteriota bacterium]